MNVAFKKEIKKLGKIKSRSASMGKEMEDFFLAFFSDKTSKNPVPPPFVF